MTYFLIPFIISLDMEYVLLPLLLPFSVVIVVSLVLHSSRNRYRTNIFQSRTARYIAILVLLSISLPIFITGMLKDDPQWASFGMIISYIFMGLALGLLINPIIRIITSPVWLLKRARKKFITNISTYGSVGIGSYYGTGMDDEVNGVPIKWKMRFTFNDANGKTRKATSVMYYNKDELDYYRRNNFAIKILGKHAVVTEFPFEKTKAAAAAPTANINKCRYCGITLDKTSSSCAGCGARR